MNCEEALAALPHYFYGELSSAETQQLHGHLSRCNSCQAEETKLIRMMRIMDDIAIDVLPQDFDEKLKAKIESVRRPRLRKYSVIKSIGYAVAALLLLSIGLKFIFLDLVAPKQYAVKDERNFFATSSYENSQDSNIPSYFEKMKNEFTP